MNTIAHTTTCSCGTTEQHVVARRLTSDGYGVALWCDGAVTGRFGNALPGVPIVRPRKLASVEQARRAGWLFVGDVGIHALSELGPLYAACRWAAERDGLPGSVRTRLGQLQQPSLTPVWQVLSAEPSTLEVLRVATWGHPALRRNASSKLYAACGSRALELGYDKLITSILDEESGVSLRASGFVCVRRGKGGSWNRAARPREDKAPTGRKTVWARGLTKHTRKAVETARIDAS